MFGKAAKADVRSRVQDDDESNYDDEDEMTLEAHADCRKVRAQGAKMQCAEMRPPLWRGERWIDMEKEEMENEEEKPAQDKAAAAPDVEDIAGRGAGEVVDVKACVSRKRTSKKKAAKETVQEEGVRATAHSEYPKTAGEARAVLNAMGRMKQRRKRGDG